MAGGDDRMRRPGAPTRREFLGNAARATALAVLAGTESAPGWQAAPASAEGTPAPTSGPGTPWWRGARYPRSRVADVRSGGIFSASVVEISKLRDLLERGLQALTGALSPEKAWREILGSAERIVLKFNSVGAGVINTNHVLARVLVDGLANAGYGPNGNTLVEAPEHLTSMLRTQKPTRGWGAAIPVGKQREALATYLYEADAIINVPQLKTHQIAGMSGCLKNLSHALIQHPARYHGNACSPYVGQVVGSQEVSSRLRLNVVNALRVVIRNGPDAQVGDVVSYGGLLMGFDPVAVDTVGLELLAVERRRLGLPGRLDVRYLTAAGEAGVGRWRAGELDRVTP